MSEEKKEAAPAKNKTKLFMIIGVVVVLLAGIGGGAMYMMSSSKHKKADASQDAGAEEDTGDEEEASDNKHPAVFSEVGVFTTNLAYEDGNSVIQLSVSAKLKNVDIETQVKTLKPEISDFVIRLLNNTKPSEMKSLEGKELAAARIKAYIEYGLHKRKKEPAVTATLKELKVGAKKHTGVEDVLFTSMIVQ